MKHIAKSIPFKISLAILIIELVLLTVMGIFYSSRFNQEIDARIAEKLALPSTLMNQRAMTFDSVQDLETLSDLIQEKVVEAFIFKRGGTIFFTADPSREGEYFMGFLNSHEKTAFNRDSGKFQQVEFTVENGDHFISSLSPLKAKGELLGGLYVRMSADAVEAKKQSVIKFFCLGSFLVIVLTSIIEIFIVHRLFVPRITDASDILEQYAGGDFGARITNIGALDQLGDLMLQVNFLLETIATYTGRVQALNAAGEAFGRVNTKEEIIHIATEKVEQQISVRKLQCNENDELSIFCLPTHGAVGTPTVKFTGRSGYRNLVPADTGFIYALSGLIDSSFSRIEAFAKIARAEAKYRDLFLSAFEGIFRINLDGMILDGNPALAAIAGYESVEELVGTVYDLSRFSDDSQEWKKMVKLLIRKDMIQDYEIDLLRWDGSVFSASLNARVIRNRLGKIQSIEGRVVDISEKKLHQQERQEQLAAEAVAQARLLLVEDLEKKNKQLQETLDELKATQKQLVQSEKMAAVGMTAGGVAHDLNNILAGVVGYPELLLATMSADNEIRPPLEAILASGRRAVAVVADLLTLAQGSARIKQHALLDTLVEEYLESVEFKEMMRGYPDVQVSSICEAEKTLISCSPVQIQKVIMNLVKNAVEAVSTPDGSVVLRTWLSIEDIEERNGERQFVILEVCDNGSGISMENRDRIFEPFYTRKIMGKKGTGLGLTVVWNVVREHGGRVELESELNRTLFRVFLPVVKNMVVELPKETEKGFLKGTGRILVVDDEPLQLDIAEKMLMLLGYEVTSVSSGEEAVSFLRHQSVDLVLLDMLMPPGMNGYQTYKKIFLIHPGQKALIVSGFSESTEVKKAMDLGVGGFVKKPYSIAQIAQAIKNELVRVPTRRVTEKQ